MAGIGRSSCPGLNALVDQGYIPRGGRNISPAQLADAMIKVLNLEIEAFDFEIQVALNHSTTGKNSTFNLEDSNVHNSIEIDGSLSRNDLYFAETIYFNQTIWNQTASKFHGDVITIPISAETHASRVAKDAATVSGLLPHAWRSFFSPFTMMKCHQSEDMYLYCRCCLLDALNDLVPLDTTCQDSLGQVLTAKRASYSEPRLHAK